MNDAWLTSFLFAPKSDRYLFYMLSTINWWNILSAFLIPVYFIYIYIKNRHCFKHRNHQLNVAAEGCGTCAAKEETIEEDFSLKNWYSDIGLSSNGPLNSYVLMSLRSEQVINISLWLASRCSTMIMVHCKSPGQIVWQIIFLADVSRKFLCN